MDVSWRSSADLYTKTKSSVFLECILLVYADANSRTALSSTSEYLGICAPYGQKSGSLDWKRPLLHMMKGRRKNTDGTVLYTIYTCLQLLSKAVMYSYFRECDRRFLVVGFELPYTTFNNTRNASLTCFTRKNDTQTQPTYMTCEMILCLMEHRRTGAEARAWSCPGMHGRIAQKMPSLGNSPNGREH